MEARVARSKTRESPTRRRASLSWSAKRWGHLIASFNMAIFGWVSVAAACPLEGALSPDDPCLTPYIQQPPTPRTQPALDDPGLGNHVPCFFSTCEVGSGNGPWIWPQSRQ